ncbi:DUF4386 family protein [Pseudonocardia nigra]|uniref:DUF4386 family protein n=1 Tax=Pseudonocardia nigra TaxID=1921578 RepID=UPI001C5CF279|nr:DUF4386 family protein [Pseudonocardia nigra]
MTTAVPPALPAAARRRHISVVAATSLWAAPLVALAARVLLIPWYQDNQDRPDNIRYLTELAAAPVRNDVGAALTFLSAVLFVGAACVLTDIARRRMPRTALAAGALVVVGAFGLASISVISMAFGEMARVEDRAAMVALLDRLMTAPQFAVYSASLFAGAVGAVLLAIGLYRSRLVPRAAAVLTGIGTAAVMVTAPGPLAPFIVRSAVLALAGLAWVAIAARRVAQDANPHVNG